MATRRWLGNAVDIFDVWTVTVANTWAAADTVVITINGKDLTITIGSLVTTAQVATTIKQAFNSETFTDTTASCSPSGGGQAIPEMAELTASVSSSVVSLTGNVAGRPHIISVTETTAGDGTATESNATVATGKHFFDNVDNWSEGDTPDDADDVVFDSGDVDLKYALDQNGVTPASITITQGYTGKIGLPFTNEDNSALPYNEYRDRFLKMCDSGDATNTAITIGDGDGNGSGRINLDCNTGQFTANVRGNGQRAEEGVPAIQIKGGASTSELNVMRGDVGVALLAGETSHLATVRVGYLENVESDSQVVLGSGVDLADANIDMTGGYLQTNSANGSGTIELLGGTLEVLTGAHASIIAEGGTVLYRSTGTLTTGKAGTGAVFDFRRDNRARTVTNYECHKDSETHDPARTVTWSNGLDLYRCSPEEVTLNIGTHLTLTPSNI